MTIEAKIIADSMSPAGIRLTTMQLRYPRFIHAEFMTHRVFSRNASSSRAIPVERMIEDLRRDPATPVFWGSNKPGMQAGAELAGEDQQLAHEIWLAGMESAIFRAQLLMEVGLHKQIANRILEPWAHINIVVTATDWDNFFALRAHPDAQPEIHALALEMFNALAGNQPKHLKPGEWHLPFADRPQDIEQARAQITDNGIMRVVPSDWQISDILRKVSVARCARVSFLTHDGRETTLEEDQKLYERLVGSKPIHASPAEHQGTPDEGIQHGFNVTWIKPHLHGNFNGWIQHRKILELEIK